jgi:hypothetical protein
MSLFLSSFFVLLLLYVISPLHPLLLSTESLSLVLKVLMSSFFYSLRACASSQICASPIPIWRCCDALRTSLVCTNIYSITWNNINLCCIPVEGAIGFGCLLSCTWESLVLDTVYRKRALNCVVIIDLRGSVVGWGTMLQAGRSRVRFPD